MIRVYVDLYDLLVRNTYQGIADGKQELFEFLLVLFRKLTFQINDKFRAVPVFDIRGLDRLAVYGDHLVKGFLGTLQRALQNVRIHGFLPGKRIVRSRQELHQALSAGINNSGLL